MTFLNVFCIKWKSYVHHKKGMRKIKYHNKLKIFVLKRVLLNILPYNLHIAYQDNPFHKLVWKKDNKYLFYNALIWRGSSVLRMLKTSPNPNEK